MDYLEAAATISKCGLYRYDLTRLWNPDRDTIVFCMLNPSKADAIRDDATIRRCVGFAERFGYGRLVVVNLFALRATDPRELAAATDPVGPDNDATIVSHCAGSNVVCAWGSTPENSPRPLIRNRPWQVLNSLAGIALCRHLGLTRGKSPKHPLYLPNQAELQEFGTKTANA